MASIIKAAPEESGAHLTETQSHRTYPDNWNGEGWITVPPELEDRLAALAPWVRPVVEDGTITALEAVEPPAPEPSAPSELDTLREQNQRLAAQVEAQSGQMEFLESCLAEMAAAVYA